MIIALYILAFLSVGSLGEHLNRTLLNADRENAKLAKRVTKLGQLAGDAIAQSYRREGQLDLEK